MSSFVWSIFLSKLNIWLLTKYFLPSYSSTLILIGSFAREKCRMNFGRRRENSINSDPIIIVFPAKKIYSPKGRFENNLQACIMGVFSLPSLLSGCFKSIIVPCSPTSPSNAIDFLHPLRELSRRIYPLSWKCALRDHETSVHNTIKHPLQSCRIILFYYNANEKSKWRLEKMSI